MRAAAACSTWRLGRPGERGATGAGGVGQPPVGGRGEHSPEKAGLVGPGRGLRGQRAGLGGAEGAGHAAGGRAGSGACGGNLCEARGELGVGRGDLGEAGRGLGGGARGYWGIWRWDQRAPCTAVEPAGEGFGASGMESKSLGRAWGSRANLQSKDCRGWAWGWRL